LNAPEDTGIQSGKLLNLNFVISGVFKQYSREDIQKMIEVHGGKNLSAVSSHTNYIVAGDGMGPSKREKALKMGIPILTEDEFLRMIQ
jgi:DNA ligase (NAD+)